MPYYTVRQGDCLSSLASHNGLASWKTVYYHPDNSAFREKRPDANLIYPGDKVFIPEKETREESGATEQLHRFRRKGEQTYLRVRLIDMDGNPISGALCRMNVALTTKEESTDGEGKVECVIPPTEQNAKLVLLDEDSGDETLGWELELGFLDPIDEVSGVQGRLRNLSFDCGPVDGIEGPLTRAGVREFQDKFGLVVDGIAGPKTKAKLEEVHDT